uniref:EscU/YscU/HrcU family type III secretion system export apparatus switch protein n=1 Tax=Thaumasiovibrio occultus TaxID=1891184 RepID=UPI000B354970|nr:EscU/YscU/HrcU family type III secretion system export apparatus switch protein [Thaumasiovibrio occultus]
MTKKAIALKYEQHAPTVTSKGYGELANAMIDEAKRNQRLIHEDAQLIQWLETLDIGDAIPEPLFVVIAELIAMSWYLDGKSPPGWEGINTKV